MDSLTVDCEQGSQAWIEARLGIPTASQFSRIVTPTGRLSTSRDKYIAELLAEYFLGEPVAEFGGTEAMERGKLLEPDARSYYGFHRDEDPQTVGFIYFDETKTVGCSPDGLVGEDGLLELKCPAAGTHLLWLARGECPREHVPQVQGQLWVTRRKWCDFVSYFPSLPPFIIRVQADERYQDGLDEHLPTFVAENLAGRDRLREMGINPAGESFDDYVERQPLKGDQS